MLQLNADQTRLITLVLKSQFYAGDTIHSGCPAVIAEIPMIPVTSPLLEKVVLSQIDAELLLEDHAECRESNNWPADTQGPCQNRRRTRIGNPHDATRDGGDTQDQAEDELG